MKMSGEIEDGDSQIGITKYQLGLKGNTEVMAMGYLNCDVWHWIVGYLVDDLRINRDFPLKPNEQRKISEMHTEFDEPDEKDVRGRYGHKIYGYLIPPEPGAYSFKLELSEMTAATSVELWLSTDSNPLNISLILSLLYDNMDRPKKRDPTSKSQDPASKSEESQDPASKTEDSQDPASKTEDSQDPASKTEDSQDPASKTEDSQDPASKTEDSQDPASKTEDSQDPASKTEDSQDPASKTEDSQDPASKTEDSQDPASKTEDSQDPASKTEDSQDPASKTEDSQDPASKTEDSQDPASKTEDSQDPASKTEDSQDPASKAKGSQSFTTKLEDSTSKSEESNDATSKSEESNDATSKSEESSDATSKSEESSDATSKSEESNDATSKSEESSDATSKSEESNDATTKSEESSDAISKYEESSDATSKSEKSNDATSKSEESSDATSKSEESSDATSKSEESSDATSKSDDSQATSKPKESQDCASKSEGSQDKTSKAEESKEIRDPISKSEDSKEIMLDHAIYYFELLEKAFDGRVVSDLKWKTPSSQEYVTIPSSCYAMAIKVDDSEDFEETVKQFLHDPSLPSNRFQDYHKQTPVTDTIHKITDLQILPEYEFQPLYAQPRKIETMTGHKEVHETKVYPPDKTWFSNNHKEDTGNQHIAREMVEKVKSLYEDSLKTSTTISGSVVRLLSLEETANKEDGSRFLLEMEVQLHEPQEEIIYTSEYVYLKKDSSQLCHTSNFQWTKNAEVHLVVSVKNLGLWIRHLVYNMEDIYQKTGDEHFSLIIVDYESEDMDIEQEVKKSSFKKIHVLNMKGDFSRSAGLQAGIDYVKDVNSIVMTIDMHLTLPIGIVEYVRRHTVQYKMAFTPMFFRLNKGHTEINCNGYWEKGTYGLFSMYKSDWLKSGGFDTERFTTKWGGEDWDALDRSLEKGFEAFRIRPPGLVHYHHTRVGMWGNKGKKFTKKWRLN